MGDVRRDVHGRALVPVARAEEADERPRPAGPGSRYGLGGVSVDVDEILAGCGQGAVEIGGGDADGFVLLESACGGFHDGEGFGKDLVEGLLDGLILVLDQLLGLSGQFFLFGDGDVLFHFLPDLIGPALEGSLDGEELLAQDGAVGAEFIVRERIDLRVEGEDLVKDGLDLLHIPVGLGSEHGFQYSGY